MIDSNDILKQLEDRVKGFHYDAKTQNVGRVEVNHDGVITASGLSKAVMGERVLIAGSVSGVVLDLTEDSVSIILLDESSDIKEGDTVSTTGELLGVIVSDDILGRVVNPLGVPLDGKSAIKKASLCRLNELLPELSNASTLMLH